jgi:acetyltransferase
MVDLGKPRRSSVPGAVAERRPLLRTLMDPKSIALIGATEAPESVGRTFMENLISSGRTVYPVNPNRSSVLGVKAFPKISDAPPSVDLAVIVTPAATVPGLVGECEAVGVKGAVIVSAGFREHGPDGRALEAEMLSKRGRMRLFGPNCFGMMIPP